MTGLLALVVGCEGDSDSGQVSGTVTLDGQPLANALVSFTPKQGGSPSFGRTDSNGRYTLRLSRSVAGAVIGEHSVSITTAADGDPDGDPPVPPSPETLPGKYNSNTTLTQSVKAGKNTIDFKLDSQGEIVDPEKATRAEANTDTCEAGVDRRQRAAWFSFT